MIIPGVTKVLSVLHNLICGTLIGCKLIGSKLIGCTLIGCKLIGCTLIGCTLIGCTLIGCTFNFIQVSSMLGNWLICPETVATVMRRIQFIFYQAGIENSYYPCHGPSHPHTQCFISAVGDKALGARLCPIWP